MVPVLKHDLLSVKGLNCAGYAVSHVLRGHSDITDLRTKQKLVALMRNNASEYKTEDRMQFLESKGIRSHFSKLKE